MKGLILKIIHAPVSAYLRKLSLELTMKKFYLRFVGILW